MEYNFDNQLGKFNYKNYTFMGKLKTGNNIEFYIIDREFESKEDYILINGTIIGKEISLVIVNNPIKMTKTEYKEEIFLVQFMFIGKKFKEIDELKFKDISLKINNISSIIYLSSFNITYEKQDQKRYPLIIEPVKCYKFKVNDDLSIEIKNSITESMKLLGNGESIKYSEDISVILHYNSLKDINRISKDSIIIRNLFTCMTGNSEINKMYSEDINKKFSMILPIISDEKVSRFPSLLKLDESNIEKIFKIWFDKYENHNSVYDLFFTIIPSQLNPATLFLTYARILESYHRQNYDGKYASKSKFEKISKKVKNCLKEVDIINNIENEKEKEQLLMNIKSSISYSYEYTLKDRLLELFKDLSELELFNMILNNYSNKEDKINEFSDIIKDNRNYYTHYPKNKKETVLEGIELSQLNECLRLIINLIFFRELEITSEEINKITQTDPRFTFKQFYSWK